MWKPSGAVCRRGKAFCARFRKRSFVKNRSTKLTESLNTLSRRLVQHAAGLVPEQWPTEDGRRSVVAYQVAFGLDVAPY
nr:hypothetical protein FJN17_07740 [Bradyrhizobium symbiodeficiens]